MCEECERIYTSPIGGTKEVFCSSPKAKYEKGHRMRKVSDSESP